MLTIHWDTLFTVLIVASTAGFLLVRAALRVDAGRLLEARRPRANTTDEPNLSDYFAERGDSSHPFTSHRRPAS